MPTAYEMLRLPTFTYFRSFWFPNHGGREKTKEKKLPAMADMLANVNSLNGKRQKKSNRKMNITIVTFVKTIFLFLFPFAFSFLKPSPQKLFRKVLFSRSCSWWQMRASLWKYTILWAHVASLIPETFVRIDTEYFYLEFFELIKFQRRIQFFMAFHEEPGFN